MTQIEIQSGCVEQPPEETRPAADPPSQLSWGFDVSEVNLSLPALRPELHANAYVYAAECYRLAVMLFEQSSLELVLAAALSEHPSNE